MIFEEAFITNLLKCNQCDGKFTEYDQPRSLPCGKIVCNNCVLKIEKEATNKKFKCPICSKHHVIPEEGFVFNELAYHLVTSKPTQIWRGKKYEKLKINLIKIESLINELKLNFENGADQVKEYCQEQRRLVQLATEKKIQELQIINEKLIKEIDEFETESIDTLLNGNETFQIKSDQIIDEANKFLKEKEEYLKKSNINDDEIKEFNKLSEDLHLKLNEEITLAKASAFKSTIIEFKPNINEFYKSIIGSFNYKQVNPYSSRLLSASWDKTIKLWDLNLNVCMKTFQSHRESVCCVKQAPKNKLLSGDADGIIKIWHIETGELLKNIFAHQDQVNNIEIISNNKFLSCSEDKTIKLFDLNNYGCIRTFSGHTGSVRSIDSLSDDRILSCSSDKTIRIWNLSSSECLRIIRVYSYSVTCVKALSDEKIMSSSKNEIKIWNIKSETCLQTLTGQSGWVRSTVQLSNDKIVSSYHNGVIKVWNINSGECLLTFQAHLNDIFDLKKITENKIISCSADKTIKIWNVENAAECLNTLEGHSNYVYGIDTF